MYRNHRNIKDLITILRATRHLISVTFLNVAFGVLLHWCGCVRFFLFVPLEYRIYKTATPLGKTYAILHISSQLHSSQLFPFYFYTVPSFFFKFYATDIMFHWKIRVSASLNYIYWISNIFIPKLGYTSLASCRFVYVFWRYIRVLSSPAVLYRNLCVSTTENYIRYLR